MDIKEIIMLYDTTIKFFLKKNYVPVIDNLGFHVLYVIILISTYCGQTKADEFSSRKTFLV